MLYALYHAPTETLGMIAPLLIEAGLSFQECHVYSGDDVPADLNKTDGLIVMGGPMNVDETHLYPFLAPETRLIEKTIAAGKPILGICLGSQLIAKALGEKVFSNHTREVGWHPIHLTNEAKTDTLFKEAPQTFDVLHWHGDTYNLPRGATHLAYSEHCKNQAFRFGENVYGLQFHLEVDAPMVKSWVQAEGSEEYIVGAKESSAQILEVTPKSFGKLEPIAKLILNRWIGLLIK